MQENLDLEKIEYKKLAKWNIQDESIYQNMTAYDYNFHIWGLMNYANNKD